ncbi:MAG: prepilin-type N-terminal cleavage/methylation domain-containing protein [Longimicrobiales bacterium]|nr:prepilin-type N-terminal cleavage/methylation domain-containing protein [Longimicrobiales bacterium]
MSSVPCRGSGPLRGGFTLIEVLGALVIFSLGVLMVLKLTGALSKQMEYATKTSELVAMTQERLDSLEAVPFDSLSLGTRMDTVSVRGIPYVRTATISKITGILYQIDVTMAPTVAGGGAQHLQPILFGGAVVAARRGGFTLVEAIVALTLSSVLVVLVSSVFLVQNRYFALQMERTAAQDNARMVTDMVASEIRSVTRGGVALAENKRLVVRSPMVMGVVCASSAGPTTTVHLDGGDAGVTAADVAGLAQRNALT